MRPGDRAVPELGSAVTAAELGRAESMVAELLDATIADEPRFLTSRRLVGLAGTVTTLASLQMGLDEYDPDRIHHSVLTADERPRLVPDVGRRGQAGPAGPGGHGAGTRGRDRGRGAHPGQVMDRFGFDECLVSEADILDGMVAGLLEG